MRCPILARAFLFLGFSVALASSPPADDPCVAFTWDIRHERTLFDQEARQLAAANAAAASPTLTTDRLYQLHLKAQPEITFVIQPGKKMPNEGETYAGLASLTVETGGVYRIALDQALWVDVIVNDSFVPAKDFQGHPGCNALHKIVEFLLPARIPITIQFSGGRVPTAKVTVTRYSGRLAFATLPPVSLLRR
jgi:hypothetical protein